MQEASLDPLNVKNLFLGDAAIPNWNSELQNTLNLFAVDVFQIFQGLKI